MLFWFLFFFQTFLSSSGYFVVSQRYVPLTPTPPSITPNNDGHLVSWLFGYIEHYQAHTWIKGHGYWPPFKQTHTQTLRLNSFNYTHVYIYTYICMYMKLNIVEIFIFIELIKSLVYIYCHYRTDIVCIVC